MVMTSLRFEINSKNLDLNKLLEGLGLKGMKELNYKQFTEFIKHIHPHITKDEINFFVEKMDQNEDGSISIQELSTEMEKHNITFFKPEENLEMLVNHIGVKKS